MWGGKGGKGCDKGKGSDGGGYDGLNPQVMAMANGMAPASASGMDMKGGKGGMDMKGGKGGKDGGKGGCGGWGGGGGGGDWGADANAMWDAMWGAMMKGGGGGGFGPWGGGKGGDGGWGGDWGAQDNSGPYVNTKRDEKEKRAKEWEEQEKRYEERNKGPFPYTDWLFLADSAKEVSQGWPQTIPALEFSKDKEIFSDSHKILQYFFDQLLGDVVTFEHDWDGSIFPEVHEAWKKCGNQEGTCTVAKCQSLKLWAVGFGGKDKALRAAKLALALCVANISAPHTVETVVAEFPKFSEFCLSAYNMGANGVGGGGDKAAWATGRLS